MTSHDNVTDIVERCQHGVRWPHPCDDCHEEDMKPHNLIARIEAQDEALTTLRKQLENAREALRQIKIEAEREQGHWQHLKRVIAVHATEALKGPQ